MNDNNASDARDGLLVSNDLMFTSKILGTAQALGYRFVKSAKADDAVAKIVKHQPRLVIVDLTSGAAADFDGMSSYRQALGSDRVLLAFGPHVEVDALDAARRAGCDVVMPRSKFSMTLPDLLQHHLGPSPEPQATA